MPTVVKAEPLTERPLPSRLASSSLWPLGILCGLNAVDELDRVAFGILTPQIRDDFGLSISGITAVVGVVGLLSIFGAVYIGYLADRHSRVRLALAGAIVWAFFSLLTGLAAGLLVLGIARFGSSVGKAVVEPTHKSLLADYYPLDSRARVYSLHAAANGLGLALAPLLAGAVAYAFGWRSVFVLFAVPTLVLVLLGARHLSEPVRGVQERLSAGLHRDRSGFAEPAPTLRDGWREIHRVPSLRRVNFSLPFLSLAFIGLAVLVSQLYEERYDLNSLDLGLVFGGTSLLQLVGLVLFGRVADRQMAIDPRRVYWLIAAAAPLSAVCYIAIASAPNLSSSMVALGVLMFSTAPLAAGPATVMSLVTPPRMRSTGYAVAGLYLIPGFVLLMVVAVVAERAGFTAAFLVMAPFLLLGNAIIVTGARFLVQDMDQIRRDEIAAAETCSGYPSPSPAVPGNVLPA